MSNPDIPWDPTTPTPDPEQALPLEVEALRARFDQVKTDEAQVEQRKTELIQTVRERIATLERILIEAGSDPAPAPAPHPAARPAPRLPAPTPVIDYVRRELTAVGHPIETADLRQALLIKYHLPVERLKNLSQVLYKAKSIVKAGGKVGLASWTQPAAPALRARRKRAAKPTAAKETLHANQ